MKFNTVEELLNYTKNIIGKTFKDFDSEKSNLILVNYDMLPSLTDVLNEIINSETMLVLRLKQ